MLFPVVAVLHLASSAIADEPRFATADPPAPPPAAEQPPPPEPPKLADPAPSPAPEGPLAVKPISIVDERLVLQPGRGITARSPDGTFSLTLRARAQVRNTYVHDELDTNELSLKTLRLYLNGHAFKLQADYFYVWGPAAAADRHSARIALDASI